MRIYDCSMFFNEELVSRIKITENSHWIDETHITEANRTFKNNRKAYSFPMPPSCYVKYHRFSAENVFRSGFWDYSIGPWWMNRKNCYWFNEALVRNASVQFVEIQDEDIIILSDIDEIIDSKYADEIIWAVQKHGIVTVKLHLSHFYFDLFVEGWTGPADYSYRVFILTGKHFHSLKYTPDQLRKAGESGKLINDVYCLENFVGFHHSWIGNLDSLVAKIHAYSHAPEDHDQGILDKHGKVNPLEIQKFLEYKRNLFSGRSLHTQDDIRLLSSIYELKEFVSQFLLREV